MPPRVRLDLVVEIKEREAEDLRRKMAEVARKAQADRLKASELKAATMKDHRHSGTAFEWDVIELAHRQSLVRARVAEEVSRQSTQQEKLAQGALMNVQKRVRALKQVADKRRDELIQEHNRKEQRALDEMGLRVHGNGAK